MAIKRKFIKIKLFPSWESIFVLGDNESVQRRTIKLDLTKKLKGKSSEGIYFIKRIDEELYAFPKKIELLKSYITKIIRKRTSYVEDSFSVKLNDVNCKIKFLLVTRRKVSRSIKKSLREKAKDFINQKAKEKTFLEIWEEITTEKLQKELMQTLKKIYPLSSCEIRFLETKETNLIKTNIETKKEETKPQEEINEEE